MARVRAFLWKRIAVVGAALIVASAACPRGRAGAAPAGQREFRNRDIAYPELLDLAHQLGADPARVRDFVREHVRFAAYPGAQRGPRGAWLAGEANSIDSALLVCDLLRI